MQESPGETAMTYYCLHKFHWKPSEYLGLSRKEKAMVHVLVRERIEQEKKEQSKMKAKGRRK
jgi:hypothetical protein